MNEETDQDGYEEVPFTWGLFFKGLLIWMAILCLIFAIGYKPTVDGKNDFATHSSQ